MTAPRLSDLQTSTGPLLNTNDWDANCQTLINFLTTNFDVTFGNIVAATFTGNISGATGFPTFDLTAPAGEAIDIGDVVRISTDGELFKATNAESYGIQNVCGISTGTFAMGATVTFTRYFYSGFEGLTPGDTYFVGVDGAVTSSEPPLWAKPIGFALTETSMIIQPLTSLESIFVDVDIKNDAIVRNNLTVVNDMSVGGTLSAATFDGDTISAYDITAENNITTVGLTSTSVSSGTISASSTVTAVGDIRTVPLTDYSSTSTVVGWSSTSTKSIYYKQIGKTVIVYFDIIGTSNSTSATFTVPFTASVAPRFNILIVAQDNGTYAVGSAGISGGTISCSPTPATAFTAWTNSGAKIVRGQFVFDIA
jgi:hypothetical protein